MQAGCQALGGLAGMGTVLTDYGTFALSPGTPHYSPRMKGLAGTGTLIPKMPEKRWPERAGVLRAIRVMEA